MAATASAQTQGLERVGPTSPVHGFPQWYQDKSGVTLEFCSPLNAAELAAGACLLLPADTVAPETFPTAFSDEHFYFAADGLLPASAALPGGARLVIGLEAAFAVGPVRAGDQITFARIRIRFDATKTGNYTVVHPYGTDVVAAVAGQRVFVTEDIGITCQGNFECALRGRIGPFLLPSLTPGGAELPPYDGALIGVPGKKYIADPIRSGPVTGSPFNQNEFKIIDPDGVVAGQTFAFTLMGRLFTGSLGGRLSVNRATYSRTSDADARIDVFANAFATTQPRLPGTPPVAPVTPALGFFVAPCVLDANGNAVGAPAGTAIQMYGAGSRYYGEKLLAGAPLPASVCVEDFTARDAGGQTVPSFVNARVADLVRITKAEYNPASGGSLTVEASSSDKMIPPALAASLIGPLTYTGLVASGTAGSIFVPPSIVAVTSAAGGRAELEVSTLVGQPDPGPTPFAGNDTVLMNEDTTTAILVLDNDTVGGVRPIPLPAGVTVELVTPPALGTAVVNADGTIQYTPRPNAFGSDLLTYVIKNGTVSSNQAFVSITVRNINDAPVAVNDADQGVGGLGFSINLLANDSDPDGQGDLVGVSNVVSLQGIPFTVTGGTLTFSAPAATYTFTYQARDAAGLLSNVATVTITIAGQQSIGITRADYIANKRRWRIDGTTLVQPNAETIFVMYADGTFADGTSAVGYLVGSTQAAAGIWTVDFALAGANDPRNPTSTLFAVRPTRIYAISSLGGNSPVTPITVR